MRQLSSTKTLKKSLLQLLKSTVLMIAQSKQSYFESDNTVEQLLSIEVIIRYCWIYKLKLYISM
jgi:hypothetical protein